MINSHLLYQLSYRGTVFQQTRIVLIAPVLVKLFRVVFSQFQRFSCAPKLRHRLPFVSLSMIGLF